MISATPDTPTPTPQSAPQAPTQSPDSRPRPASNSVPSGGVPVRKGDDRAPVWPGFDEDE